MNKSLHIALGVACAVASASASAQKAGDWVLGTGWLHFAPQDSSTPLTFTAPVPAVVPGSGATVGNANTLGFNAHFFITDHWAVEGVIGVPPRFDLYGSGTLAPLGKLGSAKQWSPTLVGKYFFGDAQARFRPYLGAGVTYVRYTGVELTSSLQGTLNSRIGLPPGATTTSGELDSSFAPVLNAGLAWQFDRHWGASLSVSYIHLKTTADLTTRLVSTGASVASSQATIKINPIVTYLALTYRF
ncbi:MAG: OmpW family outer membrane protein [Burkholderiales bacterium]